MFYVFSKLFWIFAQPLSLIFLSIVAGLILAVSGFSRLRNLVLGLGAVFAFFAIFSNVGALLIAPLEQHYARPTQIPPQTYGAIVLGGGVDAFIAKAYESYELNAAGDRLVEALRLATVDPDLKILVTGGVGELSQDGDGDGVAAQRLFGAFGLNAKRFLFETRSRSTFENAVDSKALLGPETERKWLLVTSAFHMPRALKTFEAQGFNVVPWPVDYRAAPNPSLAFDFEKGVTQLSVFTLALHEWAGLFAYWISGKIASFWP